MKIVVLLYICKLLKEAPSLRIVEKKNCRLGHSKESACNKSMLAIINLSPSQVQSKQCYRQTPK